MTKHIITIISIILCACTTCKVSTKSPIQEILFGHGGGVTQSITTYTLKPDGSIYKGKEFVGKVNKKDLSLIYAEADSLKCKPFNMPSNTFSFIQIIKNDTSLYYCWAGIAPLPIMNLDTKLYKLLPK